MNRAPVGGAGSLSGPRSRGLKEGLIGTALAFCAGVSILVTLGIAVILTSQAVIFFSQVSPVEFFTGMRWTPLFREKHFGILPLLSGSLMVTFGAGLVALPGGLLAALYLSEYAGSAVRSWLSGLLEILVGIPTVVYGYFALTLITPALRSVIPGMALFNAASAAIVVGIMILPMVASLAYQSLSAVPGTLRDAAYALGASKPEVAGLVVVPAALPGIVSAFVLALSRALGETMIVTLAAGNSARLAVNPLEPIETMTAYILQVGMGEITPGTLEYRTLFAVGMTLFVMTMAMNLLSQWVTGRVVGGGR